MADKKEVGSPETKQSECCCRIGSRSVGLCIIVCMAIGVFLLAMMFASVMERRNEAQMVRPLTEIGALEADNSKWATNWPREYSSYKRMTDDTTRTEFGGAFPRDYLEEMPENVILFAGYGFAKDYLQARGHIYAVEDVKATKRINPNMPATCWTCKSPDVPRLMAEFGIEKLGDASTFREQILAGAADFYNKKFPDFESEITHPIGCLDCHDPDTMALRITRPALIEAFERQGRDINEVSHQEMRTLVCAQCHVEYYFKGDGKYLTFPWDDGTKVEGMAKYYDDREFKDWTHAISKAPMVKMQHPDYEMYLTGIHSYRDVSCADCHMPYRTEGGVKFTDHHIQSPLLNISNSCAVCHRWGEEEIRKRVTDSQKSVREARLRAETTLSKAHFDIAACMEAGATDEELGGVRKLVRDAQLRWDYVAANNGMGFHSPLESSRILVAAVEMAQECRRQCARILAKHGYTEEVAYPPFGSKEEATTTIGRFIDGEPPSLLKKGAS